MTVKGQTILNVGVYLSKSVLSRDQLCGALSERISHANKKSINET